MKRPGRSVTLFAQFHVLINKDGKLVIVRETTFMPDLASRELITLAQRGNVEAIGGLYDAHYQAVFLYFKARLGH